MFKYYTSIIIIAIMSMLGMQLIVKNNQILSKEKKSGFSCIFIMVIIVSISEWLGVYFDQSNLISPIFIYFHILAKVIEFSIAPVLSVVYAANLDSLKNAKVVIVISSINAILEVLNFKFKIIFSVDENNIYHREKFYWIYMATYLITICFMFIRCCKVSKQYQNKNIGSLAFILMFLIFGTSIQIVNKNLRVDWVCCAICSIMFYIYYNDLIQQVDALTLLLNRKSYENSLNDIKKSVTIVFFDVNKFKFINDTYGHASGDICLREIANLIKKSYGKYGFCYRIGGDEFCAILNRPILSMDLLNQNFNILLAERKKEVEYLPSVAIGYSVYNPTCDTIDDIVSKADANMYENKEANR